MHWALRRRTALSMASDSSRSSLGVRSCALQRRCAHCTDGPHAHRGRRRARTCSTAPSSCIGHNRQRLQADTRPSIAGASPEASHGLALRNPKSVDGSVWIICSVYTRATRLSAPLWQPMTAAQIGRVQQSAADAVYLAVLQGGGDSAYSGLGTWRVALALGWLTCA